MFDFKTFNFGAGQHMTREDGMCVMEAVAYVAGDAAAEAASLDAAMSAARDSAWAAAVKSLEPTVRDCQKSAIELLTRMLALTEKQEPAAVTRKRSTKPYAVESVPA